MYITMQLLHILGQKQENILADICRDRRDVSFEVCIEEKSLLNGCLLDTSMEKTEDVCVLKCYTLADCMSAGFSSNGSCQMYRAPNSGEICRLISDVASNYFNIKDGIQAIFRKFSNTNNVQ